MFWALTNISTSWTIREEVLASFLVFFPVVGKKKVELRQLDIVWSERRFNETRAARRWFKVNGASRIFQLKVLRPLHKVFRRRLSVDSAHWDHPLAKVWQVGQPPLVGGGVKRREKTANCAIFTGRLDLSLARRTSVGVLHNVTTTRHVTTSCYSPVPAFK